MIKKKKSYVKPKQIFESGRIKEENALVKKYGLKNKREIWKTQAKVNYYRTRAKEMARLPPQEQEVLFNKLRFIGLDVKTTSDVLDLKVESLLDRRLATVVATKKLADTPRQARQMIVHKRILIDGKVVNSPSFIVPVSMESHIKLKEKKAKPKIEEKKEEAPAETAPAEDGDASGEEKKEESQPEEQAEEKTE